MLLYFGTEWYETGTVSDPKHAVFAFEKIGKTTRKGNAAVLVIVQRL